MRLAIPRYPCPRYPDSPGCRPPPYTSISTIDRQDYLLLEQFANSPLLQTPNIDEKYRSRARCEPPLSGESGRASSSRRTPRCLMAYCYLPVAQLVKQHRGNAEPTTKQLIQDVLRMSWDAIRA